MDKKSLSEQDICSKFILPAVVSAGWDLKYQIREQVSFTAGKIMVRGKTVVRGDQKRADFVLYYKNELPIAIIEAKDNKHAVGAGMEQALDYAELLDIPFVYSSNGDAFIEHDRFAKDGVKEREIVLSQFPTPEELYERYKVAKGITDAIEPIITQDYYNEVGGKTPRYFQRVAINRIIEATAKGQNRQLLVMATGTGKTYTAFQIIWRLWKAKAKKRILFLVDRNILADQTMINDFKHFGDKMTKIENHTVDKSYEIYLALYQGVTGNEEDQKIFKQFSSDFFDLIVVDECHRGSAKDNSPWREILDYYSSATQIGLTATPKETKDISSENYFGAPVYKYSLRQGIEDGFLAPYKVMRILLDSDIGYRPEVGKTDKYGHEIPDRIYSTTDIDRTLVIDERTELVAKKLTEYLKATDRMNKTIVFCVDIDHAERIRKALVNENADMVAEHRKYIARITGDSHDAPGDLDNFIDPENPYPVIAVTSKLMTTGVDAQTCKVIVLDSNIASMTEFKQIIGRGTRVREDYGKMYFTIMDFRNVTELFADPDFDGDPVVIYEVGEREPVVESDPLPTDIEYPKPDIVIPEGVAEPRKLYIAGVEVKVVNERVQYIDEDGKLITESIKDYSKAKVLSEYASLDDFLQAWSHAEKKEAIVTELQTRGVFFDELEREIGKDFDPFDLICHIAYDKKPMTRRERITEVKACDYFAKYSDTAKEVINALLEKYADKGIAAIDDIGDLQVAPFTDFGTPLQIVDEIFGGRDEYVAFITKLQKELYAAECLN